MKTTKINQIIHWVGFAIGIAGVFFVVVKLSEYWHQINLGDFSLLSVVLIFILALFYCFGNLFLALAWKDLLSHLGVGTKTSCAIQIYGLSQIGKYIPGNIFQFAGRQAIGQAESIPSLPLAKTVIWEIGLLAFTGVFFPVLLIPLFVDTVSSLVSVLLFVILFVVSYLFIRYLIGEYISQALWKHLLYLIFGALIFNVILMMSTSLYLEPNIFVITSGAYILAWLAGLLTPGAPAGLGVREVVILTLLHSLISESELLKAILLGRIVTIGGDVFFYLVSLCLRLIGQGCTARKSA